MDNSPENREKFLPFIKKNAEGKRNNCGMVAGVLIAFLAAALIAIGISACSSLVFIELSVPSIFIGCGLAALSIAIIKKANIPTGKAYMLSNFYKQSNTVSLGTFKNTRSSTP